MTEFGSTTSAEIQPGPVPKAQIQLSSSIIICTDTRLLEVVGDFVRKNALIAGFNDIDSRSIELAIDEMVSNAIIHGYSCAKGEKVSITINILNDGLMIILEEKGKQFDPFSAKDPEFNVPLAERKIGGLGLYIVKQIMDEIYYEYYDDKRKRFTLIKRIRNNDEG